MLRTDLAARACESRRPLPHGRGARRGGFDWADHSERHHLRSGARVRIRQRGGPAGRRQARPRRPGLP